MFQQPTVEPGTNRQVNFWRLTLISLSVVLGFQVFRVFVTTLSYDFGEKYGQTNAVIPAFIVFLTPFLSPLLSRLLNPRKALFASLGGLAVIRLVIQFSRSADVNMILSGMALALALIGLTLGISWLRTAEAAGRIRFGQGLFLGMTIDSALHSAFLTWDYAWQPGAIPVITAMLVSTFVLFALWDLRTDFDGAQLPDVAVKDGLSLVALGPFFMLEMLFLQNVGFIASSALTPMEVAITVVLAGNVIGFVTLNQTFRQRFFVRLIAGVALIGIAVLLPIVSGPGIIASVLVGQAAMAVLLPSVLSVSPSESAQSSVWRTSILVGLGSLLFAILAMLYYVSTLITLPFSYTILPSIGAVIVFGAAFAEPPNAHVSNWRLVTLSPILLLIPLAILITRPDAVNQSTPTTSVRLVDYNIHQAVNTDGWLDPETIAATIEAQRPGLVTLQEISRGWLLAGSLDVAEWLSRRLNMPYIYAPGHDYQFGNILLTRMPIRSWSFTRLPLHEVPLGRSFIQSEIDLGSGQPMMVITTHLSAFTGSTERIPQVQKILETWAGSPHSIIVGDMNAHPGDSDIALYLQAGLTSAQDATGNGNWFTFRSVKPVERIDWIFGTPDIQFSEFAIPTSSASDHLPLAVTVTVQ